MIEPDPVFVCALHGQRHRVIAGAKRILAGECRMSETSDARNLASYARFQEAHKKIAPEVTIAGVERELNHSCKAHCQAGAR